MAEHPITRGLYLGAGLILVPVLAVLLFVRPAQTFEKGDVIEGKAVAIDGDTIEVRVRVRVQGIAAPERYKPGGDLSTEAMRQILDGEQVRCTLTGRTNHDRQIGVCRTLDGDIGYLMVESGGARDCPKLSGGRYAVAERPGAQPIELPPYCRTGREKGPKQ
ncbi:MAG: thermonuclease family protein [Thalassobaculum sp.]